MKTEEKLRLSLLLLRLGVFAVKFIWTLDKFINPDHAIGIFKRFYFLGVISNWIMYGPFSVFLGENAGLISSY